MGSSPFVGSKNGRINGFLYMGKKIGYKIYTLGCKVNQYDSGYLSSLLDAAFCKVNKNADLAIVNTCTVTKKSIAKNRSMLNKARNENPNAKMIIFGCWPKSYKNDLEKVEADLVWPVGKLEDLARKIYKLFNVEIFNKINVNIISSERSRYFLKIQDGCEQFCTYCIIPYNRGKISSRKESDILFEAKKAIERGFKEIVLCGIHLGQYGKEKREKDALYRLMKKLIMIDPQVRFRLSSIEIGEITDNLIKLFKIKRSICPHLHIPLQSGSDKILKLMNRPYDRESFLNKILKIKKAIPNIALTADVLVGFPGEISKDFNDTKDLIKKAGFSRLHIFPFSAHEKTPAYYFTGQVVSEDKKNRARVLRELNKVLEKKYQNKFKNKYINVLIEKKEGDYYIGKNEYYFEVRHRSTKEYEIGDIVKIKY